MKNRIHIFSSITLKIVLLATIFLGLFGAARLSYTTATGSDICPSLLQIPACYLVLLAYIAMLLGVVTETSETKPYLFYAGLVLATAFALPASIMELFYTGTCPNNGSIPLCYLSLALCLLIGMARFVIKKTKAQHRLAQ